MTTTDDIDDLFKGTVKRDQWGRPMLVPKDGNKPVPYIRASSLGDAIQDFHGLNIWERRLIIKGLGEREDLAARAGALPVLVDDRELDRPTNRELDVIGQEAFEAMRGHAKANWGTAVHGFTDPGQHGPAPLRMEADVASYFDAIKGIPVVEGQSELFVANDALGAAGTFDAIHQHPAFGRIVGDKKTGKLKPLECAVQMAVYAGGDLYDVETDQRAPLELDNRDWGLIIHIPVGQGRTDLYMVDLRIGRAAAMLAMAVRAMRKRDDLLSIADPNDLITQRRRIARELLQNATTTEELRAIWADFEPVLTDEMRGVFASRAKMLTTH